MGISFNSYMCGEYFWRLVDVISNVKCVSTHICAGNVSVAAGHTTLAMTLFQLIYAWGMFHGRAVDGAHHRRFNSYMRGECFYLDSRQGTI